MIVINKNGVVYIAQSFYNNHSHIEEGDFINHDENLLMFKPDGKTDSLIGVMGDSAHRQCDVLRYEDIFPKRLTKRELLDNTYYKIFNKLSSFGLCKSDCTCCDVFFAKKGRAYVVSGYGAILEIDDFYARSLHDQMAFASYLKNKDKEPYDLIRSIYQSIERAITKVQFPVVVLNTKTNEKVIIEREEIICQ